MPSSSQRTEAIGASKQPAVIAALTALAKKLGPGAKLPTFRELSSSLGVTKVTLARGLAHLEDRGILRCRQGSGIYVEIGAVQKRVALVFGSSGLFSPKGSPFGMLLIQQCCRRALQKQRRFSFYIDAPELNGFDKGESVPVHQDLVDDLNNKKIDGIILVARSSEEEEIWLRAQGIPVVGTSEPQGDVRTGRESVVIADYEALIREGVERLRKAGCKTLGLIGVMDHHQDIFKKAVVRQGGAIDPRWIAVPPPNAHFPVETHEELGRDLAARWLKAGGKKTGTVSGLPDGLLITDDIMAKGVLAEFGRKKIGFGTDLKIATHANRGSFVLSEWDGQILKVEFDPEEMAAALFEMLDRLLQGKTQGLQAIGPVSAS